MKEWKRKIAITKTSYVITFNNIMPLIPAVSSSETGLQFLLLLLFEMEAYIRAGGLPVYFRCEVANKTNDEWYQEGVPNVPIGIFSLIYNVTCQLWYIPCLIVFCQRDLFQMPVYKLMLFVTLCDMINLTSGGIFMGWFFIDGVVYCNYPNLMYIWGSIEISGWAGCCIGCFFLILTRLVDIVSPSLYELLFSGKRIWFTFAIMISYMLMFLLFAKPALFNSAVTSWIFDPLIYNDGRNFKHYFCYYLIANNIGTVSTTFAMYLAFFIIFAYKMKRTYGFSMERKQKQLLVQSCIICVNNLTVAMIYVWFNFYMPSPLLITMSRTFWQFSCSSGVFVFYIMNHTVRRRIFALFGLRRFAKETTITPSMAN